MTSDRAVVVAELARQEGIIERSWRTFVEVGNALAAIRDQLLYRMTYATFEDYCQQRWGMSRSYAYRTITAADVVHDIAPPSAPAPAVMPSNEAQTRPLAALPVEQRRPAWDAAVATAQAESRPVTAKVVEQEVRARLPEPRHQRPHRGAPSLGGWLQDFRNDVERMEAVLENAGDDALAYLGGDERRDLERTAERCYSFWSGIIERLAVAEQEQ